MNYWVWHLKTYPTCSESNWSVECLILRFNFFSVNKFTKLISNIICFWLLHMYTLRHQCEKLMNYDHDKGRWSMWLSTVPNKGFSQPLSMQWLCTLNRCSLWIDVHNGLFEYSMLSYISKLTSLRLLQLSTQSQVQVSLISGNNGW